MIDDERLKHIPSSLRQQHSFCFWIHDLMLDVMKHSESARVADVLIKFDNEDEASTYRESRDPIGWLLSRDNSATAKRIVMNQVAMHLYWDILHFIYEGLKALEKRKYTVAFALFRKPFKYSMMFATWMLADSDDFYARLKHSPSTLLTDGDRNLSKLRRLELLQQAIKMITSNTVLKASRFDAEVIYNVVYNKKHTRGLSPLFEKAVHLVTSHTGIETEPFNLNFIFLSPNSTDVYESAYFPITIVLTYLLFLELELISSMMSPVMSTYRRWAEMSTLAVFDALYIESSNHELLTGMNDAWSEVMNCMVCDSLLKITPSNCLQLFAVEQIVCETCNTVQNFPLGWLMGRVER